MGGFLVNIVKFNIVDIHDNRLYLKGEIDLDTISVNHYGDWKYLQSNGEYEYHLPKNWIKDIVNLSMEYDMFIDRINFDSVYRDILKYQDRNVSFTYKDYFVHINDGASIELSMDKDSDFDVNCLATLYFSYNRKLLLLDKELLSDFARDINFDETYESVLLCDKGFDYCESVVKIVLPKEFYDTACKEEQDNFIGDYIRTLKQYYARQIIHNANLQQKYGEGFCVELESVLGSMESYYLYELEYHMMQGNILDYLEYNNFFGLSTMIG